MSAPVKAVFAQNQSQARAYAAAFELKPTEWSSFGLGAAIPRDRLFDHIVVILPANVNSVDFAMVHRLHRHLADGAQISLLSPHDAATRVPPEPTDE
jgi:hypothetical protein